MAFVNTPVSTARRNPCTNAMCSRTPRSSFTGLQLRRISVPQNVYETVKMAISANDFRPGTTIELDGSIYRVQEFLHVKPGKGAAFVRSKLKNMKTGNTVEKTFKANETIQDARLEKFQMQHTYVDGADYVFMNMETFEEERMSAAVLGDNIIKFLTIGLDVEVLKHEEDVLGVDIPKSLVFEVVETDPGVRGNTAQGGGTKPARIDSGAEVMVPLFINTGEKIIVNTENGKYVSRSNE